MDKPKKYATAGAFRRALEDRLKVISETERLLLQRVRREVAFDRLLARLFAADTAPWLLKGGYALELRIKEARATRDIDLSLHETLGTGQDGSGNVAILTALRSAASLDLGDFFVFTIGEVMMELDAAPYGGARFPVSAQMDARKFVEFHLDVGVGDSALPPHEITTGHRWLDFAGIAAPKCPTISKEQHFAEKVHAYTVPRLTPNSRVRDLVDMVLLIRTALDAKRTTAAIAATFKRRKTHPVPAQLAAPPDAWKRPFAKLAQECGLPEDIRMAFSEVEGYFTSLPHG